MARRFEIKRRMGASGFGELYTAVDRSGVRGVVELVHRINVQSVDLEMLREAAARTHVAAKHPAIVDPIGLVSVYGRAGIVYSSFEGQPLSALVFSDRMGTQPALELAMKVCGALEFAWGEAKFNHGSLKWHHGSLQPTNVYISAKGELSVIEFGLLEAVNDFDSRRPEPDNTGVFNSLAYLSPERIAGGSGPESDMYALGIMIFELVTGTRMGGQVTASVTEEHHIEGVKRRADALRSMLGDNDPLVDLLGDMTLFRREERATRSEVVSRCEKLLRRMDGESLPDWAANAVAEAERLQAGSAEVRDHTVVGVTTTAVAYGPPSVLMDQFDTPPPTEERVGYRPVVGLDLPPMGTQEAARYRRRQVMSAVVAILVCMVVAAVIAAAM